ncbi:MBL fold metallo-hydrolase [Candidatus Gribaldobacteria bacterium]|nr:MBL fold metallo-hydrolase [Candidatus Gribaldobacteria bacterium]
MNDELGVKKNNSRKRLLVGFLFLLVIANFFVWQEVFSYQGNLKITYFYIGQGDSIFIETPQKHQILIDGGPNKNLVLEKLAQRMPFWDKTIDLVILTHPDNDHLRGILSVLEKYKVDYFLLTDFALEKLKTTEQFALGQKQQQVGQIIGSKNLQIQAGRINLFVLYPEIKEVGQVVGQKSNDTSLVLRLDFFNNSFLFTGDISTKIETYLLNSEQANYLPADVLKVAHHGSKSSTSNEFLKKVQPKVAVISCGKDNRYNHPHDDALQRLENFAINILRTDLLGDIEIISNGFNLLIANN